MQNVPYSISQRIFGLDVMRAVAVLLVITSHTVAHGAPPVWFKWYFWAQGGTGVEIFYVLSGFLIGSILIRSHRSGRLQSPSDVLDFWKRRWARTLPLYTFFLLVYLRFDYHGSADIRAVWPFFLFLQNLAWPMTPFFEHSWSLAVEEWFYLLIPCVFLIAAALFRSSRNTMLATCAIFFILPLTARIIFGWHVQSLADVDRYVRSIVICRLDSLFIGVVVAFLHIVHPSIFDRLARSWKVPLALFLGATLYFAVGAPGIVSNGFIRTIFYPMFSAIIAAMLPGAMLISTSGSRVLDQFIGWTSRISYSLYLGHICMLTLLLGIFADFGVPIDRPRTTLLLYIALAFVYFAFAQLTYALVEQPYIRLRDRLMGHSDERSGSVAVQAADDVPPATLAIQDR